jgi:hypothetical protein
MAVSAWQALAIPAPYSRKTPVLGRASWNMPLDFYPGSFGHPDNLDFYNEFDLDDIRASDEGVTVAMRDIARRALDGGHETTLGLRGPDEPMVIIKFRAGAASRHVWVDPASAIAFANQPFEDYQLLERYLAIWRRNEMVEVVVRFANPLALLPYVDQGDLQSVPIAEVVGAHGETLRLGYGIAHRPSVAPRRPKQAAYGDAQAGGAFSPNRGGGVITA